MVRVAEEMIQLITQKSTHPTLDKFFEVVEVIVSDFALTYILKHSHPWEGYHQGWSPSHRYARIQFILRDHSCEREVLQGFDLHLCMFGVRMSKDEDEPTPEVFTTRQVK